MNCLQYGKIISHCDTSMTISRAYQIKVLEKVTRILDLFDEKGKELTATEIHELLELNKSTTFRILNMLEGAGYLERDPATLNYRLGFKLYYLGSLVEGRTEIRNLAHPFLEQLKEKCDETVHLVVLDHGEALYLDNLKGKRLSVSFPGSAGGFHLTAREWARSCWHLSQKKPYIKLLKKKV